MEITYNGTLTMPANFAVLDEEEMTYLDGGMIFQQRLAYSKTDASNICANWAGMAFDVANCSILAGALVGFVFGAEIAGKTGAAAGAAIGALLGYYGSNILDQWRLAYAQAARDARKLPWNGYVCIQTELIGGVLSVDFFRPPYVGA